MPVCFRPTALSPVRPSIIITIIIKRWLADGEYVRVLICMYINHIYYFVIVTRPSAVSRVAGDRVVIVMAAKVGRLSPLSYGTKVEWGIGRLESPIVGAESVIKPIYGNKRSSVTVLIA